MTDFRDIEVKAGNHSLIFTVIVGLISLLLLLISFSFDVPKPKVQPIEIAMNFGNTDVGQGEEEPAPAENSSAAASDDNQTEPISQTAKPSTPAPPAVTQNTKEEVPTATEKKTKTNKTTKSTTKTTPKKAEESKPKGDARANDALSNILSGKGKSPSSGQGNDGTAGNVGDPKGNASNGTGVGENWKSTIPEPQHHQCSTSGIIMVEVIVNASGGIKSATPGVKGSTSADACLKNKAQELVLKYVRAYPGSEGRKGIYKVNLR